MTVLSDVVDFRRDLFFGGAVDIDWFRKDPKKSDKAAANFVFHGPDYFGVSESDKVGGKDYSLMDTATLTREIIDGMDANGDGSDPIALAIAAYGAGKSHYALTLATLFSDPTGPTSRSILDNLEKAHREIGKQIRQRVESWTHPALVLPVNGMNNFDLADELSRRVLQELRAKGLDTGPVDDLWPRFQKAAAFVERGFSLWKEKFVEAFGPDVAESAVIERLQTRDEVCFKKVNAIYENANGFPIHAPGAESPKQLLETVCKHYCGENGPFGSVFILFDEFGRYLEFAVEKPHIAGDAALQQIFEGVQENADRCFMFCTIQYELKAYIKRVSPDLHNTIIRFVGRYDSASKKYYLSTNLETLFAHLIEKKAPDRIADLVSEQDCKTAQDALLKWAPEGRIDGIWKDETRFCNVIVEGCWPFHPMTTLFFRLAVDQLQQRSAVKIIEDVLSRKAGQTIREGWNIPPTRLFQTEMGVKDPLLHDFRGYEEHTTAGTATAYSAVAEKYRHDLNDDQRHVLLAALLAEKMGLKARDRAEVHTLFAHLTALRPDVIQNEVEELRQEYGVLEWNDRFRRYDIISDAIPRSDFNRFLENRTRAIPAQSVPDLFVKYARKLADLPVFESLDPEFSNEKKIFTGEWRYKPFFSHPGRLDEELQLAVGDWRDAVNVDAPKGQLIYCYCPADTRIPEEKERLREKLKGHLTSKGIEAAPIFIVILHDGDDTIRRGLSEYSVLTEGLAEEEQGTYHHFIEDQKGHLAQELTAACHEKINERQYVLPFHLPDESRRLQETGFALFDAIYSDILLFPFDKFHTTKGASATDCREITTELFKGKLDFGWFTERPKRLRNRIEAVLLKAWQAFSEKKIALIPGHPGLAEIIREFDNALKERNELNAGAMLEQLLAPPYGFNIASAGLVIGIFICPRQEMIALLYDGRSITPSNWINLAFEKNFLKADALKKTVIQHIRDEEWGEWKRLLAEWEAERTHSGRVAYLKNSEALLERIPLSSEVLDLRRENLKEKAEKSYEALEQFEAFLDKQDFFYGKALDKRDVDSLSRVGYDLVKHLEKMKGEAGFWSGEQIETVSGRVQSVREAIQEFFAEWLPQKSCISTERVDSFRDEMIKYAAGNLKALNLKKLAEAVEDHARKTISDIKERQRVFYSVDAAQSFLAGHTVTPKTPISDLAEWTDAAEKLKADLQRARNIRDVPEIDQSIEKLDEFMSACGKQETEHWDRHSDLIERPFVTIDEINEIHGKVREALPIYAGQSPEFEDLEKLERRLEMFRQDYAAWNDLSLSLDDLDKAAARRIETVSEEENADDMLPEWKSAAEIYGNMLTALKAQRAERSREWLELVFPESMDVSTLSADECRKRLAETASIPAYVTDADRETLASLKKGLEQRLAALWLEAHYHPPDAVKTMPPERCQQLLSASASLPDYLTDEDRETVAAMRKNIDKRLDDLAVEGLLARYRQLPFELRKAFLRVAVEEFKAVQGGLG